MGDEGKKVIDIKDIANIAGVEEDIVRKVLSGADTVNPRIKERVLRILHEKKYSTIKGMRDKKRGNYAHTTVGIILPDVTHRFWFEMVTGINEKLMVHNLNTAIFNVATNRGEFFEYLIDERFAGLIMIGTAVPQRVLDLFDLTDTKYVFVDIHIPGAPSLYVDNRYGGELAAQYLYKKGAKKIAYVGHRAKHQVQDDRFGGFVSYLHANNQREIIEKYVDLSTDEAYYTTKELLDSHDVDGIFYFCDALAHMGLQAIQESGKNVFVVGFDDITMSNIIGLTTIRQPAYEMGYDGATMLINLINGDTKNSINKCISPEFIERKT